MFSLRQSIIIILILFIPFCLRTFTGIEPYPAVLLPSGAATIRKVNGQIALSSKEIYGVDTAGNWQKINLPLFLSPIPNQYLPALLSNDFGLRNDPSFPESRRFKILEKLGLIAKNVISNKERRKEAEKWLKERLIEQHLEVSKIKIVSYVKMISTNTGSTVKNETKDERIILLDQ